MTVNVQNNEQSIAFIKKEPNKRQRVRVGDPDFESPDKGWAWIILVACGFSNLSAFPVFQQYGLVFKEKFRSLGITSTQTVTIINTCIAFNTGAGLLNGPVFKRYTSRKVGLFSSILVVGCLIGSAFCTNFWSYIIFFSIGYGGSFGLLESANALAMNTYFDKKRRIATGLSWTITAMGPVICPYIVIALMGLYGVEWTILLFAAFAMHTFAGSLTLQPVHWHTKFKTQENLPKGEDTTSKIKEEGIINTETPVMLFGSNCSLSSLSQKKSVRSRRNTTATSETKDGSMYQMTVINGDAEIAANDISKPQERLSLWKQFCKDFDFALLKDPTYVNLMIGLTATNFVELNFGLLTPVIMEEFHFEQSQIAIFMSLLAGSDNVFRLIVSLIADKIPISNRNFYLLGVSTMLVGRVVLVHTHTYTWALISGVIIGCGKALRTIFLILVIPAHVPIERLPAAYGLQYAFSLFFFVIGGPIAGLIRDTVGNFRIQMHILNFLTYITVIAWLGEKRIFALFRRR